MDFNWALGFERTGSLYFQDCHRFIECGHHRRFNGLGACGKCDTQLYVSIISQISIRFIDAIYIN